MSTKRPVYCDLFDVVKKAELLWQIIGFNSTLYITGDVYSHWSVHQGKNHGIQGVGDVEITVWIIFYISPNN